MFLYATHSGGFFGTAGTAIGKINSNVSKGNNALGVEGEASVTDINVADKRTSPIKVGKATTIYSPYIGETPQKSNVKRTTTEIGSNVVNITQNMIDAAKQNSADGTKGVRRTLTKLFENIFEDTGGVRNVKVNGTTFRGEDYLVTINKNAVAKIISDPNLSAEKLAVINYLDEVVSNGEYIGSGEYAPKNEKKIKNTTRFDYFETGANINGKPYIVSFDVEVMPGHNNYRTHKIINEISLTNLEGGEVGPVPTAQSKSAGYFNNNIPQTGQKNNSNSNSTPKKAEDFKTRAENKFLNDLKSDLGFSKYSETETLKKELQKLFDNPDMEQKDINKLFSEITLKALTTENEF